MAFCLIFLVTFVATLISSMSGGGAGVMTTPTWLMLGYPLPMAVAADKVNAAVWTVLASRNYLKDIKIDWSFLFSTAVVGAFGVFLGANTTINYDHEVLKRVIGAFILLLVLFTYIRKDLGLVSKDPSFGKLGTSVFGFPLGFYEGFFGSGNGIFSSIVLCKLQGYDLIKALGYYYVMAFVWCAFAAVIYSINGFSDLSLLVPSTLGSVVGGYAGSRIGKKRGVRFVKAVFMVVGTLFGLKLLLGL